MNETGDMIPQRIKEQAAEWLVRLELDDVQAADEDAFVQWLTESDLHQIAFAEIEQLWMEMGQSAEKLADSSKLEQINEIAKIAQPSTAKVVAIKPQATELLRTTKLGFPLPVSWIQGAALAASLVLAALLFGERGLLWLESDYRTGVGEQRLVQLSDGSEVRLNTDSALRLYYSANERRIKLLRGEAFFQVAKNADRPFVVSANDIETTALGTAFNIRLMADKTEITVTEHQVKVEAITQQSSDRRTLLESQQISFKNKSFSPVTLVDSTVVKAWQQQRLIFRGRPLGEVVEELNRYYQGHILILDESIANLKVTGVFNLTDPLATLETIEKSLSVDVIEMTPLLVVVKSQ